MRRSVGSTTTIPPVVPNHRRPSRARTAGGLPQFVSRLRIPSALEAGSICFTVPEKEARAAKDVAKRRLARRTGIVGIGLTRQGGSYALKVNLGEGATAARLPKDVNGVPVVVATVGAIRKR